MPATRPLLSILIVNWNGMAHLPECLASLSLQEFRDFEVVLVDNASKDDSVAWLREKHPEVRIVQASENLGFAGGNNVGLTAINSDGFDFGLTVAVRPGVGAPPVQGNPGAFNWGGAYGTNFWADPAERLAVVVMAHAPGLRSRHNQRLANAIVYGAINQ